MKGLIATGGTGGHIAPAIALKKFMMIKKIDVKVISDKRGKKVFSGFTPDFLIDAYPLNNKRFIMNLISIVKSLFYIKRYKPDFVIITGGYATFPVAIASLILRIPLFIIEANSVPGTITRTFAKFSEITFFAFPPVVDFKYRYKVTGLPIREEIVKFGQKKRAKKSDSILIAGGSLGAESLIKMAFKIARDFPDQKFILIRGNKRSSYGKKPDNLSVVDFCKDMVSLYRKTKITITRGGGSFLSEILYLGIPSLVVPYPYAKGNHQWYNAKFFEKTGLGMMIEDKKLDQINNLLYFMLSNYKKFKIDEKYSYYHLNPSEVIVEELSNYVW